MNKIYILFLGIILFSLSSCKDTQKSPKVVLIGIDGLQFDKIQESNTPNFDKLFFTKAYTGGVVGNDTEQKTSSGPGWTTILTGVWQNKHAVISNDTSYRSKAKSIFRKIKEFEPKFNVASSITWSPIHTFFKDELEFIDHLQQDGPDKVTIQFSVDLIKEKSPDFSFVHLDEIDGVGHSDGFGEKYNAAIQEADNQLGLILNVVEKRMKLNPNEDWLILVTTDHGRGKGGFSHGGQSLQEKSIFIASNKDLKLSNNDVHQNTLKDLYKNAVPQTAIVPIILKHLNISL